MKYTKNELVELLNKDLTPILLMGIIKERFGINDFPKNGNLCGQAVASAFFELANLDINPVYNDIDIFIPVFRNTFQDSQKFERIRKIQKNRNNILGNYIQYLVDIEPYEHINSVNVMSQYKVVHSEKMGPINKTYITTEKENNIFDRFSILSATDTIISNFDINSTQIGINLTTNKVSYTEEFVEFLSTKQLKISHWNTPVHSLIRLKKKQKELKNVYINWEESKMLAMAFVGSMENIFEVNKELKLHKASLDSGDTISAFINRLNIRQYDSIPLFFGHKHCKDYLRYIKSENNDLDLELKKRGSLLSNTDYIATPTLNENRSLHTISPKNREKVFSEFLKNIRETYFVKNTSLADSLLQDIEKLFYENSVSNIKTKLNNVDSLQKTISPNNSKSFFHSILLMPYTYNNMKNARKKSIKHFMNISKKSDYVDYFVSSKLIDLNFIDLKDYKENIYFVVKANEKFLRKHSIYHIFEMIPIKYWEKIINNLKKISKEEFGESIFGVLENNYSFQIFDLVDFNRLKSIYEHTVKSDNKLLTENNFVRNVNGYQVRLLNTKNELVKEGADMHHCVGGYSYQVKSENSIIFSVTGKNRFTIELQKNGEKYELNQVKAKYNKRVLWKEAKPILIEIDKKFGIFPITESNLKYEMIHYEDHDLFSDLVKNGFVKEHNSLIPKEVEMNQYDLPEINIEEAIIPF